MALITGVADSANNFFISNAALRLGNAYLSKYSILKDHATISTGQCFYHTFLTCCAQFDKFGILKAELWI